MTTLALATAAVLGLLGFFEPCTVATHTLYAVRASGEPHPLRDLLLLAVPRVVVLAACVGAAAAVGLTTPAPLIVALLVMGAIYLLTVNVYLPMPHLELYRLLPRNAGLPDALKLGLTLPACTLPLIVVVALLAALTGDARLGAAAGALFGAALSAPTIWYSVRGVPAASREFLGRAAHASHYVTTALLWGGAAVAWLATG
jgi:cytochrome c-type biogenesis protein